MGSKWLKNAVFGLAACQNIGINILPDSLYPKMAERSKRWAAHFYPQILAQRLTFTVSDPEKVESRARCLNRGIWMLRVQKRCFWDISTPSSGQNWRKTRFFCLFLAFFLIEIHQNIFDLGHGNKKCLGIIFRHFMFLLLKIFSLKIFHDGPQDWKHGKFKSKK